MGVQHRGASVQETGKTMKGFEDITGMDFDADYSSRIGLITSVHCLGMRLCKICIFC